MRKRNFQYSSKLVELREQGREPEIYERDVADARCLSWEWVDGTAMEDKHEVRIITGLLRD